MTKKLKDEINNLKKKNGMLWNLLCEVDKLSVEYHMSVFEKIRIKRLIIKTAKVFMEYGYLMRMKDGEEQK